MNRFRTLAMTRYAPIVGLILTLISLITSTHAQSNTFTMPPESGRIFAISTENGLSIAEKTDIPLPVGTIDVDWNPADPSRWARVDHVGLLRFVPEGSTGEGTYTFSPYFEGYQVASGAENKLFMRDVEWSPDGRMLAFRIQNDAIADLGQGVWFWTPIFELSTDPSYQILRHCPPFCSAAGSAENAAGWRATNIEWSSDNNAILIRLNLLGEGRRALEIRFANREAEPPTQAGQAPSPLLYEYGHWANDGQRIIVSGRDPDGVIVVGTISREGNADVIIPASTIGMAWVQDAVQTPQGQIVMLGSAEGQNAPLQLIDDSGDILTAPIGDSPPIEVEWSPNRDAVLVRTSNGTYIATVDGRIVDITSTIDNSPNISWVTTIPQTLTRLTLPPPISQRETATPSPEPSPVDATTILPPPIYEVGTLLRLQTGRLNIYTEPVADADVTGVLNAGQELIITSEPLNDGTNTWYRVQTLQFSGWIQDVSGLVVP